MIEVKSAGANTIRSAISFIGSLLFAIIIFRYASTEDVGTYYFWLSLIMIGGIILQAPMNTMFYIMPKTKKEKVGTYFSSIVLLLFLPSLLLYYIVFSLAGFSQPLDLSLMGAITTTLGPSSALLFSSFELRLSIISTVLGVLGKLSIVAYGALLGKLDFMLIAIANTTLYVLSSLLFLPLIRKVPSIEDIKKTVAKIKENIEGGLLFYIISALSAIMIWTDIAFIGIIYGAREVGIYNAIANIMKYVLITIPASLSFFILPLVVKFKEKKVLGTGIISLAFLLGPLVASVTYPEPFVQVITGGYGEFSSLAYYFVPAMLVMPLQALFVQYFLGKQDRRILLYLSLSVVLNIALNYLLSVSLGLGLVGVALGSSLASLIYVWMMVRAVKEVSRIVSLKVVGQLLLVTASMFYARSFLPTSFESDGNALLYSVVALATAFLVNSLLSLIFFRREISGISKRLLRGKSNITI